MARSFLVLIALVSGVANAAESTEPLTFAQQPSAVKAGEKVKLSFAVSQKTDVEVAVLNAAGEVVRHLASGSRSARRRERSSVSADNRNGTESGVGWQR